MDNSLQSMRRFTACNRITRDHSREQVLRWLWLLILVVAVNSCISIPDESWIIRHRNPLVLKVHAADCAVIKSMIIRSLNVDHLHEISAQMTLENGLNANGFSFTTWNIKKGKTDGWDEDLEKLCRNTDILILQEAYLTDHLKTMLRQQHFQWDLSVAYEYKEIAAGVLTASKITPNLACTLKATEPITRIPKSILITRYPISAMHRELLVVNIHAINFTTGYVAFQKQYDRLESALSAHQGPMIISGDFNTWNSGRMSRVEAMVERLNLSAVPFKEDAKSTFFGRHLDHVYYRGLEPQKATSVHLATSDHNPLLVEFKVVESSGPDV